MFSACSISVRIFSDIFQACQTEYSTSGKLTFFLSTTNGVEASSQVTHVEQTDKVWQYSSYTIL